MVCKVLNIFFSKREVWLPTWQGLLLLLLVIVITLSWAGMNLARFLAQQHPIAAPYLVVEGWLDERELKQAVHEFRNKRYERLITTGGPIDNEVNPQYDSYAQRAGAMLRHMGIKPDKIIIIPAPASAQERTYLSAVMVRKYLAKTTLGMPNALNVFTSGVHARRSFYLYKQAFRKTHVKLGIMAATPSEYSLNKWWQTSAGAKTVLTEFIGWLWVKCFFEPGAVGSHIELWGKQVGQRQQSNSADLEQDRPFYG